MSLQTGGTAELRTIAAHRSVREHLVDIWRYRELVVSLIGKELKVRYKNSVLGFLWSMVQPVFLLLVYSMVFSILGAGFEDFAIWLLCGLIVWTMTSTAMSTSAQSITSNGYLVSKVAFPRVVLPISTLGSALVHFLLQLATLAVILLVVRHPVAWSHVWLVPLALVTTVIVCAGVGIMLSALNVYARDTQHLLDMLLVAWFWLTPVLYQYERASQWFTSHGFPAWLPLVNPMTSVVIALQRSIYGSTSAGATALLPDLSAWWYARNLLIVAMIASLVTVIALRVFDRAEGNFAEVL